MPELAAHLERVARERTAEIVACAASEFCPHETIEGCIEYVLAAALAACARESEKPLREALTWAIGVIEAEYGKDGPRLEQEEFLRAKAALERAVGEKA